LIKIKSYQAQEKGMYLRPLIVAGAVLFATSAFAQTQTPQSSGRQQQQQPRDATTDKTNAQGERPTTDKTMQEKDTGLMNQSGGAPGASGATGTQSGTPPNTGAPGSVK
jgi:hypothetical protein